MSQGKFWLGFITLLFLPVLQAENEQGTGNPTVQVLTAPDQRVMVQAQEGGYALIGSDWLSQGYGDLVVDAIDAATGELVPGWGRAEVLLGCGVANVLLYRQEQGQWVEVAAVQAPIAVCVGQ